MRTQLRNGTLVRVLGIVGVALFLSTVTALAGPPCFADEFQSAMTLYQARRYDPAHTNFTSLAAKAPSPRSKAECLAHAASSLARLGKYEQALALADTIEVKALAGKCRMGLMLENKDERKLIAEFRDEAIDAWPEAAIPQGYYSRGLAYLRLKDYPAAVSNLEQAVRQACDGQEQVDALLCLAGTRRLLNNVTGAVEAYRRALAVMPPRHSTPYFQAVLGLAAALSEQGQHDEAFSELKRIDLGRLHGGDWHLATLQTYGAIQEAQGRTNEAIASYRAALSVTNAQAGFLRSVSNRIDHLTGKRGETK